MTERREESQEIDLGAVSYEDLVREQLRRLGEDPSRPGLTDTPRRVAASMKWLTRGYRSSAEEAIGSGVFVEEHDNMILVKDIEVYSLCEHHMLPFFGKAHVAYIPEGRLLGLSKIPRVVEVFARRLQVQERLTTDIADIMMNKLQPKGVLVVMEAEHLCMSMRGVRKPNAMTVTSAVRGSFRRDERTRSETLALIHGSSRR